mmetsp:Transcript_31842/g.92200  ORF Transcript_31842/g.92200 Transcript_31842/m.92200 type:complete len:384 (+) Transcript_31842:309-1460(+)
MQARTRRSPSIHMAGSHADQRADGNHARGRHQQHQRHHTPVRHKSPPFDLCALPLDGLQPHDAAQRGDGRQVRARIGRKDGRQGAAAQQHGGHVEVCVAEHVCEEDAHGLVAEEVAAQRAQQPHHQGRREHIHPLQHPAQPPRQHARHTDFLHLLYEHKHCQEEGHQLPRQLTQRPAHRRQPPLHQPRRHHTPLPQPLRARLHLKLLPRHHPVYVELSRPSAVRVEARSEGLLVRRHALDVESECVCVDWQGGSVCSDLWRLVDELEAALGGDDPGGKGVHVGAADHTAPAAAAWRGGGRGGGLVLTLMDADAVNHVTVACLCVAVRRSPVLHLLLDSVGRARLDVALIVVITVAPSLPTTLLLVTLSHQRRQHCRLWVRMCP